MKYIIEHLEKEVYEWCLIEYEHISKIVGKRNLIFTNIKSNEDRKKLIGFGEVYSESVHVLINSVFSGKRLCLLDLDAEKTLSPSDVKKLDRFLEHPKVPNKTQGLSDANEFDFLVFGGILGDYPPKARTKELLGNLKCEKRNLWKEQMSTDNAVYTSKKIISGVEIEKIKFKDEIEIRINDKESTILPYRYVLVRGKPLISEKLLGYLRKGGLLRQRTERQNIILDKTGYV